jgi:hypothetical protein
VFHLTRLVINRTERCMRSAIVRSPEIISAILGQHASNKTRRGMARGLAYGQFTRASANLTSKIFQKYASIHVVRPPSPSLVRAIEIFPFATSQRRKRHITCACAVHQLSVSHEVTRRKSVRFRLTGHSRPVLLESMPACPTPAKSGDESHRFRPDTSDSASPL